MKIKKHGKLFKGSTEKDKYEQFKCENCGCEFSVKEDEYYRDYGKTLSTSDSITATSTYVWSSIDTFVCSCPECYKICKKYVNGYPVSYSVTNTCNCDTNKTSALDINNEVN